MSKVINLSTPFLKDDETLLTLEEVRAISGCESYTDEQALAVADTITTFATVIVNNLLKNGTFLETEKTIPLNQQRIAA